MDFSDLYLLGLVELFLTFYNDVTQALHEMLIIIIELFVNDPDDPDDRETREWIERLEARIHSVLRPLMNYAADLLICSRMLDGAVSLYYKYFLTTTATSTVKALT